VVLLHYTYYLLFLILLVRSVSDYVAAEQARRKDLGVDPVEAKDAESSTWSTSNRSLAQNGSQIVRGTLRRYNQNYYKVNSVFYYWFKECDLVVYYVCANSSEQGLFYLEPR
jgi:hypothetical protein